AKPAQHPLFSIVFYRFAQFGRGKRFFARPQADLTAAAGGSSSPPPASPIRIVRMQEEQKEWK
ncbi:MAG: hypothetical protein WCE68_11050, partial [Anaerolineales bacterium]